MSGSDNDGARGEQGQSGDQRFMMEALTGQLRALMREIEGMREEMGEIRAEREQRGNARQINQAAPRQQRARPRERWEDVEDEFEDFDYEEVGADRRRYEQSRQDNRREDDNLGSIKSKIPEFKGRNDPEAYLEWEKSMREIDRLIEEVIKLMEQVDEEKLGFSTSLFVASKVARNRPKRKPIWTTMWN